MAEIINGIIGVVHIGIVKFELLLPLETFELADEIETTHISHDGFTLFSLMAKYPSKENIHPLDPNTLTFG
jgi:hypothetical protein